MKQEKFQCILCLCSSGTLQPVELTRKVDGNHTVEDCIVKNVSCFPTILNDPNSKKAICTNCFTEFVNFYEFLQLVESNHEGSCENPIKAEPLDNFIDIGEIPQDPSRQLTVLVQDCSVLLERVDAETIKFNEDIKVKVEELPEINEDEKKEEEDEDDFEWPEDETTKFPEISPKVIKRRIRPLFLQTGLKIAPTLNQPKPSLKKPSIRTDADFDPNPPRVRKPPVKLLPSYLATEEILALPRRFVTIDGVKYRKKEKPSVKKTNTVNPKKGFTNKVEYVSTTDKKIAESVAVKCWICDQKLLTFIGVKKHFYRYHPKERPYLKCWCGERKFKRRYELIEHLEWHENNSVFKCNICNNGKNYKLQRNLQTHIELKHSGRKVDVSKNFICDTCGTSFRTNCALKYHMEIHFPKREYECYICHKTKVTYKRLKNHMQLYHGKQQVTKANIKVTCEICSKVVSLQCLRIHMKNLHSNVPKKTVQCSVCDKTMMEITLKKHMETIHGLKSGFCEKCKKYFSNIQSHHSIHENLKNRCHICQAACRSQTKLKEHIAVHHTREFPFSCRMCSRTFRFFNNCKLHEKGQHKEEYMRLESINEVEENKEGGNIQMTEEIGEGSGLNDMY